MSTFQKVGEKMNKLQMDNLWSAILCHYSQLPRPSGAFTNLERLHCSGISLDGFELRRYHSYFLYSVCHCQPVRRSFH